MFFRYNFYTFLWAGVIFAASLIPGKDLPTVSFWELLSFDKAAHMFVYGVFVFLMIVGFLKQYTFPRLRERAVVSAIVMAVLYGGILEVLQGQLLSDRYMDMVDMLANVMGVLFGWVAFQLVYFKIPVKNHRK